MEIFWSSKLKLPRIRAFHEFLQGQANRLMQGHARYSGPDAKQEYHRRLKLELQAYNASGNAEHLYNIANYALLESLCPQHPKFHRDTRIGSVTRKHVKTEKDTF